MTGTAGEKNIRQNNMKDVQGNVPSIRDAADMTTSSEGALIGTS